MIYLLCILNTIYVISVSNKIKLFSKRMSIPVDISDGIDTFYKIMKEYEETK